MSGGNPQQKFDGLKRGEFVSPSGPDLEETPCDNDREGSAAAQIRHSEEALRDQLARERSLREEAESARQRSAFLAEATLLLSSSLDLAATFKHIAQLAVSVLADWCVVDMLRDDGKSKRVSVAHADPTKLRLAADIGRHYPPERWAHPVLLNVLRDGRSVMVPEITDELLATLAFRGVGKEYAEVLRQFKLESLMTVPIMARSRVVGAITFMTAESHRHYGPDDLALAEALSRSAAMAVENARLFEEAHRSRREAEALEAVSREITSSLDHSGVFERIVEEARELCAADLAFFATYDRQTADRQTAEARIRALSGTRTNELLKVGFRPGRGAAGKVLMTGGPLATEDYRSDPRFSNGSPEEPAVSREYFDALVREGVAAVAVAPARFRDEVTGVLWVAQRRPHRFSDRDTAILAKLANQAAIALENSGLYAQAQQLAVNRERVRMANELHDTLSQLLFSMALKLDWCLHKLSGRSQTRDKLQEIRREAGLTMTQIRRLISELSQEEGPARTLSERLQLLIDSFRELTGISVEFTAVDLSALDDSRQKVVYSVVQEGLANVAKHAQARHASVRLERSRDELRFEITDDGIGLSAGVEAAEPAGEPGHFGLRQMSERLAAIGGRLDVGQPALGGFRLAGTVPVKEDSRDAQDSDHGR